MTLHMSEAKRDFKKDIGVVTVYDVPTGNASVIPIQHEEEEQEIRDAAYSPGQVVFVNYFNEYFTDGREYASETTDDIGYL